MPSPAGNVEACGAVRQDGRPGNSAPSFMDVIAKRQIQRADQSGAHDENRATLNAEAPFCVTTEP